MTYPLAILLTLAFEVPVALWLLRGERKGVWSAALSASLLSHPILWFVLLPNMDVLWGEFFVFVFEAGVYFTLVRPITLPRALATSLLANLFSYIVGSWVYARILEFI